jgi:hypothetical protein
MSYQRKNRWTESQIMFLKDNHEKMKDEQIAEVLGRTLKAVRLKRARLNLPKASGRSLCESLSSYKARTKQTPNIESDNPPILSEV